MRSFLSKYLPALVDGQRLAIESRIVEMAAEGRLRTPEEAEKVRAEARGALARGEEMEQAFQFIPYLDTDELASERFNQDVQNLALDLEGLSAQSVAVSGTVSSHEAVARSGLDPLIQSIRRVTEAVLLHRVRKLNASWDDVRINNFSSAENATTSSLRASILPGANTAYSGIYRRQRIQERGGPGGTTITAKSLSNGVIEG